MASSHHITATASNPQRTLDFYTALRFVERTIDFDDQAEAAN